MDARLLDYYNRELGYLRDLGAEFAREYPKVAGRLGMDGMEVADPYVERLLEGFSFLTARIQMKMDAEFPRLSQRMLEVLHPNYLAPLPSMIIARFDPSMNEGSLARGFTLARGTALRGQIPRGEQTACEYRTAHELTLWPIRLSHAALGGIPVDLPLARWGMTQLQDPVRHALRMEFELCGGTQLEELSLDELSLFLAGQDGAMQRLLEAMISHCAGVVVHEASARPSWFKRLGRDVISHDGFGDEQALLPGDGRGFQGYRLLQEYFAFPCRYQFVRLKGLSQARTAAAGHAPAGGTKRFAVTILLTKNMTELEGVIDAQDLALHCTPAINLFPRRADRLTLTERSHEHHVVVDRSRPLDYEVYEVQQVLGHASAREDRQFRPFYQSFSADDGDYGVYFNVRREPRLVSDRAHRQGPRSVYLGSETFVSLVDRHEAPHASDLRQLSVDVLCTNRDLPLLFSRGLHTDFTLRVSAPVQAVKVLRGPSRPRAPLADGQAAWRLVSHMGLNYLQLVDLDEAQGAAALREILATFGEMGDAAVRKQIQGVRSVKARRAHRRMPVPGPIVYGRGVRVEVEIDETAFSGQSPFLFGAVLERFLARHVSINAFTEMHLSSLQGGYLSGWPARVGGRTIL